ncbi:MAG: hypothetical protein JXJ22_16150, partial [Bacteroidales bacterium]|nr:hypothetical protein [Bacteroidales bacterium]
MELFNAIIWTLILLTSFYGWGLFLDKLFKRLNFTFAQKIVFGIAWLMALGGWFNFFGIISAYLIFGLLLTGLFFNALWIKDNLFRALVKNYSYLFTRELIFIKICVLILLFFVILFAYLDFPVKFNTYDDFNVYFTIPLQMLQAGNIQENPFLAPLIFLARGESFLQTFIFSFLSLEYAYIIDLVIGSMVTVLLILDIKPGNKLKSNLLIIILFLLVFPDKINSSFIVLPVAFFITSIHLLITSFNKESKTVSFSLAISLLATGLLFFKLFNTVYIAVFFLMAIVINKTPWSKKTAIVLLTVLFALLFYLPWMMFSLKNYSTLFYPVLGKGTWNPGMVYSVNIKYTILLTLKLILKLLPVLVFLVLSIKLKIRSENRNYVYITAFVFCYIILTYMLHGMQFIRYNQPVMLAVLILFVYPGLLETRFNKSLKFIVISLTVFIVAINDSLSTTLSNNTRSLSLNPVHFFQKISTKPPDNITLLNLKLNAPEEKKIYKEMFSLTEGKDKVLAGIYRPYLIDYSRYYNIYLMYQPLVVLPYGDVDVENDTAGLVNYLSSNGIRFIAASLPPEVTLENLKAYIESKDKN